MGESTLNLNDFTGMGGARTLSSPPYDLIDKKRLIVRGGSAGGYTSTVLAALWTASDMKVFAGAASFYGISDLAKSYEFTHKFESKYAEKLVGGTPQEVPDVCKARSPIYHADNIVIALLVSHIIPCTFLYIYLIFNILQGDIDMVVPEEQSVAIYDNIKRHGGDVEYKL